VEVVLEVAVVELEVVAVDLAEVSNFHASNNNCLF
jgi:hypothetical protein